MSRDISNILDGWDYDPRQLSVRIVQGDDGQEKIQMRIDLGLRQMNMSGRPDGQRPEGFESWLEFYQARQQEHDAANPDSSPFSLDDVACARLMLEGVQYYHRYVSFWRLQKYELCARDTSRNLKLFRFVREYAPSDRERLQFDQYRPYVTMIHTRAVATPFIEMRDYEAAIKAIDAGINAINVFLADYQQSERAEECTELVELKKLRRQVLDQAPRILPPTADARLTRLRDQLHEAIENERYEEAAKIRDDIRAIEPG